MRLGDVVGFELRLDDSLVDHNEGSEFLNVRLVAFSAEQDSPVYVSEKLEFKSQYTTKTNKVSFAKLVSRRSFRVALQLHSLDKETPRILKSWVLDLRTLKNSTSSQRLSDLTIIAANGAMVIPESPKGESESEIKAAEAMPDGGIVHNEGASGVPQNNNSLLSKSSDTTHGTIPESQWPSLSNWLKWGGLSSKTDGEADTSLYQRTSFSYSTLVDIWTLERILEGAWTAIAEICEQINLCLPKSAIALKEQEAELERRISRVRKKLKATVSETSHLRTQCKQVNANRENIEQLLNNSFTEKGRGLQNGASLPTTDEFIKNKTSVIELKSKERSDLSHLIRKEQARLASELLGLFPIEPIGDGKFHFAINGLLLPSVFAINHYDTSQIGTALGYVAQVVVCLSRYLDIVLPYPITVCGSQSFITDDISEIKHGSTKFPLWTRGALLYRVEYALYLLHKDIEQLMNSLGLAVADLKQTLANLKNLLLVVSSASTALS